MVYGELGRTPLKIVSTTRVLGFWYRLIKSEENKLSCLLYKVLHKMSLQDVYTSKWLEFVRNTLNNCGFSLYWINQDVPGSLKWFKSQLYQRLCDQFKQNWSEEVCSSGKCVNYRMFKVNFEFEKYLIKLSPQLRRYVCRFRCRNHRLPVELIHIVNLDDKKCTLCDLDEIGDEFHYLLKCTAFQRERSSLIKRYYYTRPSSLKLYSLMNSTGGDLIKLAKLVKTIMDTVR